MIQKILCAVLCLAFVAPALATGPVEPHPVLNVTEWSAQWNRLEVVLENPSEQDEQGWLVIWFVMDGQSYAWAFDVSVPAESYVELSIVFPSTIQVMDVQVYVNGFPDGVVEAPDPIVAAMEQHTGQ